MNSSGKIFLLSAFLGIMTIGCSFFRTDVNEYIVAIKFVGNESAERLENVSAIIGADKFWWESFQKNEKNTVTLSTKKNSSTNLTVLYTISGEKRSWESVEFSESDSYRIELEINASGDVKENICKMPCRF